LQNFTQKDLTEVKIFQKVLGFFFLKHPVHITSVRMSADVYDRPYFQFQSKFSLKVIRNYSVE